MKRYYKVAIVKYKFDANFKVQYNIIQFLQLSCTLYMYILFSTTFLLKSLLVQAGKDLKGLSDCLGQVKVTDGQVNSHPACLTGQVKFLFPATSRPKACKIMNEHKVLATSNFGPLYHKTANKHPGGNKFQMCLRPGCYWRHCRRYFKRLALIRNFELLSNKSPGGNKIQTCLRSGCY